MLENLTYKELLDWIAYFIIDSDSKEPIDSTEILSPAEKLRLLAMSLGAKKSG